MGISIMRGIGIDVTPITKSTDISTIGTAIRDQLDGQLQIVAATALACDADCVVTDAAEWLPYIREFEKLGLLLTTPDFVLRYSEIFVRGHDVPWAFAYKAWFTTWTASYQLSEAWTFKPGMEFLALCQTKGADSEAVEAGRSLVYNRLGDLSFTRDRLLFYEMQQAVSRRAQWKRQKFSSEIAYYLNFYYLLLYGAFDHAAVLVSGLLGLGIPSRRVGARSPEFLKALRAKSPEVYAVFENPAHTEFINRVATVRHTTAHRGMVTPGKVVQKPDHEPTVDELDDDIRKAGLDRCLGLFPPGQARDQFRDTLRSNARMARYERETLMEDVILVELNGKWVYIHPLTDTWWNFRRCKAFLDEVFVACSKAI